MADTMALRWICGVTKLTIIIITNERIRVITKVEEMSKNVQDGVVCIDKRKGICG